MTDWNEVVAVALALERTELGTSYGQPAIKCASNGRALLSTGGQAATAFCLHLDLDTVEMLIETDPDTYFQTPHYVGWPTVLVRYGSGDPERVKAMIGQAHAFAIVRPKVKARNAR